MKIYFGESGMIRDVTHLVEGADIPIDVYSDIDPTGYAVSLTLRRADGAVCGPYEMKQVLNSKGKIDHHTYQLTSSDTAITGELEITIKFKSLQKSVFVDPDFLDMVRVYITEEMK